MAGLPRILIIGIGGTGFEALVQAKRCCFSSMTTRFLLIADYFIFDTVAPKDHGDVPLLRDVEWDSNRST